MKSGSIFKLTILFFFLCCVGNERESYNEAVYEAFIANVEKIIVSKEINITQPVRIGLDGYFEDDCSELARISAEKSDSPNNIEITVYGKRKLNTKCNNTKVVFFGSITITGLSEGRYRIRINNNDNLVEYFSIVKESPRDSGVEIDVGSECDEEIAPLNMADITIDGFNSAKGQKIPYGTPISLIVKGYISGECRSFKGFRYDRLGYNLYVDVIAKYCPSSCEEDYRDYNETFVIQGLSKGKYTLYVNNSVIIPFEIIE